MIPALFTLFVAIVLYFISSRSKQYKRVLHDLDTTRNQHEVLLVRQNETINELQMTRAELDAIRFRYKDIIDIDAERAARELDLKKFQKQYDALELELRVKTEHLNADFESKRMIYDALVLELGTLEENLEMISYGMYKPHYDYQSTEDYKIKLDEIREKQKQAIKDETATFCGTTWTVQGSEAKGRKMVKEASKLMLRAFNGECDACVAKVSWNNISNMEARIQKAFDAINKLGSTNQISITDRYLSLKMDELHLEFELEEKKYKEKEEQRRIKEQMRDEEKALREIEKVQRDAEADEDRYQKALDKAKAEIEKAGDAELDALNSKVRELEEKLKQAHELKMRAVSQAQLTKSGHVYIISNIGSFGHDVFKVGMTRRLDPLDRIYELGDASVPFDFDVHGLIYSENAPELENLLHKKLEERRLNLVNHRAEFFKASLDEIADIVKEMGMAVELTRIAEAKEYRETISIRDSRMKEAQGPVQITVAKGENGFLAGKFPTTLQ